MNGRNAEMYATGRVHRVSVVSTGQVQIRPGQVAANWPWSTAVLAGRVAGGWPAAGAHRSGVAG